MSERAQPDQWPDEYDVDDEWEPITCDECGEHIYSDDHECDGGWSTGPFETDGDV